MSVYYTSLIAHKTPLTGAESAVEGVEVCQTESWVRGDQPWQYDRKSDEWTIVQVRAVG